ncbi:unnamed protein product [Gadus morhua 'NCC']
MTGTVATGKHAREWNLVSTLQGTAVDAGQRYQHGERDSPAQGEEDLRSVTAQAALRILRRETEVEVRWSQTTVSWKAVLKDAICLFWSAAKSIKLANRDSLLRNSSRAV